MSHIFISYSRYNLDYVKQLEQRLISEGFDVWRDNHIQGGEKNGGKSSSPISNIAAR